MIKVDCKNVPDKWQRELCKINFLKLIKKNVSKNIFSRNSKLILFPVNDFNLFIYKKKVSTYFEQISWLNFYFYFEGNYLQLFCQKNLLQNFKLTIKNDF